MLPDIIYKTNKPEAKEYFELFESTGWNDKFRLTEEQIHKSIQNSYYTVSAYDGDVLIGFGRLVSDGILHAIIYEMMILPEYQGEGVGKKILDMLLQKCFDDNIEDIQLFCARGKKGFYERMGFTPRASDAPGMQYVGERKVPSFG
jgi:GNAT superfamily N-acetyltransferase